MAETIRMHKRTSGAQPGLIVTVLFLVGIPGVFGWFLLDHLAAEKQQAALRSEAEELQEILAQTARNGDPQRRFGGILERLALQPWTLATLSARLSRLQRENGRVLDIYLFDRQGKRQRVAGGPQQFVVASQQFLKKLLNPDAVISEKLVQAFAGRGRAVEMLSASPGVVCDLLNGSRLTWGGWYSFKDRQEKLVGHVLVFIHREQLPAGMLLNKAVVATNRRTGEKYRIGWQDPLAPARLQPPQLKFPDRLAEFLADFPLGENTAQWQGHTVAIYITEAGERLFGYAGQPLVLSEELPEQRAFFLAFLALAGLLLYRSLAGSQRLSSKIIWLFAIAGGFPVAVFLATIVVDRKDQEDLLQRNTREKHLEFLAKFDAASRSEFLPALRAYHGFCRKIEQSGTFEPADDVKEKLHQEIQAQKGLVVCSALIDRQRHVYFYHLYDEKHPQGIRRVKSTEALLDLADNAMQVVNQEPAANSGTKVANPMASVVVAAKFASNWVDENETLKEDQYGKMSLLSYFRFFPGKTALVDAVFLATLDDKKCQAEYLRRYLGRRTSWRRYAPRLYAIPVVSGDGWPTFLETRLAHEPMLRKVCDLVLASGLPQHQVLPLGGRKFLVSAVQGNFLNGYILVLARPYSTLLAQTKALTSRGILIAGVVLLLVVGLAWITAHVLLVPIQNLTRGIDALRQRNFRFRVSPGPLTELAGVAHHLNIIMEDLKDLELARSVQETLWPDRGLAGTDWSIAGKCLTASQLGGDYFDWFIRSDGRLVLAVGDVAGHGIPSALVAASAKMELALNAETEENPAIILAKMNAGLSRQAGRKRPMSFWLGIFDPVERTLCFANAGQSFPILLMSGQEPRMVKGIGYPLGARKVVKFASHTLDLAAGGRLLVYSDGLVEAATPEADLFGYERLTELAAALFAAGTSPENMIDSAFQTTQKWSGRDIPEDDQTLVILDVAERTGIAVVTASGTTADELLPTDDLVMVESIVGPSSDTGSLV